jgi:hypothetical protein
MTTPTRSTTAGRAYLDLRRKARQDHRPVDELALTPDPGIRARREVALADAELVTGHPDTAREAAGDALPRLTDPGARGQAQVVIGGALYGQGRNVEAANVLADAAAALGADPVASADALHSALDAAMVAGPAETDKIAKIPRPAPGTKPAIPDLLLAGYQAWFTKGYDAAATPLRAAVRALRADDLEPATALGWFGLGFAAAGSLWVDQALLDITDRWMRVARSLGAVTMASARSCRPGLRRLAHRPPRSGGGPLGRDARRVVDVIEEALDVPFIRLADATALARNEADAR